ncbi:MAG: hypothetical protein IPH94_16625 [Saprospiraceae bacterium]|nr:hypothetical protein [Saprospiraceae bacterium]
MDTVNSFLNFLNQNRWLNVVFLILGTGSIVISIYLYFKSRKRKLPTYLMKTFNLFKNKISNIDKLNITYDNTHIENLSITKIALWNRGNEVINYSDVAPRNLLQIKMLNSKQILDAQIKYTKNNNNNFTIQISEDKKSLIIKFDYFFQNEGVVLEIFHNGTSGKEIIIDGSLKEVPHIKSAQYQDEIIINSILDNTIGILKKRLHEKVWLIIGLCLLPFIFLFFIIFEPIQYIYNTINYPAIPKEFSLLDE